MNGERINDPFDLDCESSPKRNYPARSDLLGELDRERIITT